MVSFLDPSQLRAKIAKGFAGKLLTGTLTRPGAATGVDEYGDPVAGMDEIYTVNGAVDEYNEVYRVNAGKTRSATKSV